MRMRALSAACAMNFRRRGGKEMPFLVYGQR